MSSGKLSFATASAKSSSLLSLRCAATIACTSALIMGAFAPRGRWPARRRTAPDMAVRENPRAAAPSATSPAAAVRRPSPPPPGHAGTPPAHWPRSRADQLEIRVRVHALADNPAPRSDIRRRPRRRDADRLALQIGQRMNRGVLRHDDGVFGPLVQRGDDLHVLPLRPHLHRLVRRDGEHVDVMRDQRARRRRAAAHGGDA